MTDQKCQALARILMETYHHNSRIKMMVIGARGLARRGGYDREITLTGLEVHFADEVLDILGVPADKEMREKCHRMLSAAGSKFEPEVSAKIQRTLYQIEEKARSWGSNLN